MKASTYLAALVRAHVACDPPLTTAEVIALKQSVAVLARLGAVLVRAAGNPSGLPAHALEDTRHALASLEQSVLALARAAIVSWETGGD
jgi:hypothetical protein